MIELIDKLTDDIRTFCVGNALGVKALGPILAYGTEFDFADGWIQTKESEADGESRREITAFLSKFYGAVNLYANERADLKELREFLKVIGCTELVSNAALPDSPGYKNTGCIMQLDEAQGFIGKTTDDECEICFLDESSVFSDEPMDEFLREFHRLLCTNNPGYLPTDYDGWVTDFSHRIRHGCACPAMIKKDGAYAATAAAMNVMDESIFLGAVSTDGQYRGKHYAHTLLRGLCEKYENRIVYLICKKDKQAFYEKAGFKMTGEFYAE